MTTTAQLDRVVVLLQGAEEYIAYRQQFQLPVRTEDRTAYSNIALAVRTCNADSLDVDISDLDHVHTMSRRNARINCSTRMKLLQTHCVASYLAGLAFPFWLGPHLIVAPILVGLLVLIYLPIVGLQFLVTGPWSGYEGFILAISISTAGPYVSFVLPSWYIACHIRTGRRTTWSYAVAVLLLVFWYWPST